MDFLRVEMAALRVHSLTAFAIVLAGCATTRHEPPPEVAPQPPEMTAEEVVAEEQAVNGNAEPTPVEVPATSPGDRRYRPTTLSTEEIRARNAEAPLPLDFRQRVDYTHDRIYAWTQSGVQGLDHWVADKDKPLKPVPAAPFRLSVDSGWIKREGGLDFELDMDFDIALQLPNLEDRLRIFITSGELDEAPEDVRDDSRLSAGLRYQLFRHLDFDLGVRLDAPPVPFAALKWTHEIALGRWDFYPFAKVFVETEESAGFAAAATFDRWSGRHLFRTSTYAKWRADRDRTQWSETLIYARALQLIVPDRYGSYPRANDIGHGYGLRLLASGETGRAVDRYEAGIFYRRPTPLRWLYWSVEPMVRWSREYGWNADPGVRLGLEALFWDLARAGR